ncbi:DUF962 domain-containing protein [Simiduia curdlanivorans]|uniref:Mpo1-like protein n=1 Tax=Simiduia curdlanivorans TaxID=1492769 RepID=A0ABV8V756_9GAMM|nr:Mpo1-like protein [Simiduia curdlanivorans]MDN3638885.1 DUF962 domain-containing protein [Simiduia curdlanivorans]
MTKQFESFAQFYPFYLAEHANVTCRRLHFIGSTLALILAALALYSSNYLWFLVAVIQGYAWAWVGHFFFEKNKPATFQHPLYSFIGDWVMYKDMATGKIAF